MPQLEMAQLTLGVIVTLFAGFGWLLVVLTADTYRHWRKPQVVHCPGSDGPAAIAVRFDASLDPPSLRVVRCSHWPERRECAQHCLAGSHDPSAGEEAVLATVACGAHD